MTWKLVPRTPTDEMMNAGLYQSSHDAKFEDVYSSWVDMVDVAPDYSEPCEALVLIEALEAAEHWLAEEAASPHPGQTRPDDILRTIRDALGKPHDAPDAADASEGAAND